MQRDLIFCLCLYGLTRAFFYTLGVRFDVSAIEQSWQFIDTPLLKEQLLISLYYQHSQPPLFNLFTGLVLKLFPDNFPVVFSLVFHLCSLTIYFLSYRLLQAIWRARLLAFLVSTAFILTPQVILYENWFFYTWPVTTLLVIAAFCIFRFGQSQRPEYAFTFIAVVALICLTRSMFHLIYLIAAIGLVLALARPLRRPLWIASCCAIVLVSSVFFKNLLLFDFFGSSSWTGMNLWRIVYAHNSGVHSNENSITHIKSFSSLSQYSDHYKKIPNRFETISVLSQPLKHNNHINYNHFAYIAISENYLEGAVTSIKTDTISYLKNMARAWIKYTEPNWNYLMLRDNKAIIQPYLNWVTQQESLLYLENEVLNIDQDLVFNQSILLCLWVPLALLISMAYFAYLSWLAYQQRSVKAEWILVTFSLLTIGYTAVLGNALEYGENNRFRVQTDPLLYITTWLAIKSLFENCRYKYSKLSGKTLDKPD